jgi:hypothetical protein
VTGALTVALYLASNAFELLGVDVLRHALALDQATRDRDDGLRRGG